MGAVHRSLHTRNIVYPQQPYYMTTMDNDAIGSAYEDVRNDSTETTWAVFEYEEDNSIVVGGTGSDFEEFKCHFKDEVRLFGFLRVTSGDELSKRAKFVLVSWCGNGVSPLKRAKTSTDKAELKRIVQSFAVEIQTNEVSELEENAIKDVVAKAGGANYGTGKRD